MDLPGKRRLHEVLEAALQTEDSQELDHLFHVVVDSSNTLRRQYGLPVTVSRYQPSVLKTPREQLLSLGVEMFRQAGEAVFNRCQKACTQKAGTAVNRESLFTRCFTSSIHAQSFRDRASRVAEQKMCGTENLMFLPPLLVRANENASIRFRLGPDGLHREETDRKAEILVMFFAEGPVVPIARYNVLNHLLPFLQKWYELEGRMGSVDFWREFSDKGVRARARVSRNNRTQRPTSRAREHS